MRKRFPLLDILPELRNLGINRTAQLLVISLIGHFYEKKRIRGSIGAKQGFSIFDPVLNDDLKKIRYIVRISENGLMEKFGFCKDTLINIRKQLDPPKATARLKIHAIRGRVVSESRDVKWNRRYYEEYNKKYLNYELKYTIRIKKSGLDFFYIPTRVIYDKNLSYSEKLAVIWNLSLKESLIHNPTQREVAAASGITERTIRKAKNKYPGLFE